MKSWAGFPLITKEQFLTGLLKRDVIGKDKYFGHSLSQSVQSLDLPFSMSSDSGEGDSWGAYLWDEHWIVTLDNADHLNKSLSDIVSLDTAGRHEYVLVRLKERSWLFTRPDLWTMGVYFDYFGNKYIGLRALRTSSNVYLKVNKKVVRKDKRGFEKDLIDFYQHEVDDLWNDQYYRENVANDEGLLADDEMRQNLFDFWIRS